MDREKGCFTGSHATKRLCSGEIYFNLICKKALSKIFPAAREEMQGVLVYLYLSKITRKDMERF